MLWLIFAGMIAVALAFLLLPLWRARAEAPQRAAYDLEVYRDQLAEVALQTMKIQDPVLNAQWKDRLEEQNSKIRDRDSAMQELNLSSLMPPSRAMRDSAAVTPSSLPAVAQLTCVWNSTSMKLKNRSGGAQRATIAAFRAYLSRG